MSNDPEDEKTENKEPQHGRIFTFRGKPLQPFSWNARVTLYRLLTEATPIIEEYTYLVYMLLAKTPAQMDALRSQDAISAFRIEAGEWANKENLGTGKGWAELNALATEIIGEAKKAEEFEPVPKKGGRKTLGK